MGAGIAARYPPSITLSLPACRLRSPTLPQPTFCYPEPAAPAARGPCRPHLLQAALLHGLAKVEKDGRMGSLSAMAGTWADADSGHR